MTSAYDYSVRVANWDAGRNTNGPYDQLSRDEGDFYDQPYLPHSGFEAIGEPQENQAIPSHTAGWNSNEPASPSRGEETPPQDQGRMPDGHRTSFPTPWLPYTLRWPCLSGIISFAFLLEISVVIIHVISTRNLGLVDDNGSGGIVVGSKFVPTTLAVIYVLCTSILLDDIKRTEPFARLASPSGALTESSLTWTADAWWDALFGSFPTRSRKTSWAMLLATFIFIFGFLVVSPLSSTLIVSQDTIFTRDTQFAQIDMAASMPLQANPFSTTYFRAISNILQNVTTSAWLSDKYAVVPFWPDEIDHAPLGPVISNNIQTWTANTKAFSTELACEELEFKGARTIEISLGEGLDTTTGISIGLSSQSGCTISLALRNISSLASSGGAIWLAMGNTTLIEPDGFNDTITTNACPQDEVAIFTTPLTNSTTSNLLSNFTITGVSCRASYYVGDTLAMVALSEGETIVTIDEPRYLMTRIPIPDHVVDVSAFKDVLFASNWTTHVNTEKLANTNQFESPFASGPANLLSALYNFSPGQLVADENVAKNMQKIEQRFLAELLRDAFDYSSNAVPLPIPGSVLNKVRRIVVVPAVAITLEVVVAVQLLLLAAIFIYTRPAKRPLGLVADPAPPMSLAKLITNEDDTLQSFKCLYDKTTQQLKLELLGKRYQLVDGGIRLASDRGTSNRYDAVNWFRRTWHRDDHTAGPKKVFKFWVLLGLFALLASILATIAALYWYDNAQGLYQTAFVYAINISINGIDLGPVNPASIITTLVAVCIGLWWGSIDTTLRSVQPFLALAKEPVLGSKGVSVTYRSSYLLWAAFRASKRRHLVLVLICTGAFFVEIFTVAMSSLWTRGPGTVSSTIQIPRQLQLRHVPLLSTGTLPASPSSRSYKVNAISSLFNNMRTSWIYGAAVQLSLNGSEPPWSSDGWSFVQSDLSLIPQQRLQNVGNETAPLDLTMDVTLETSAIRGRLECSPYEFLSNTSLWLTEWDLTDDQVWNLTASPNILSRGYELGLPFDMLDESAYSLENNAFFLNPPPEVYKGRSNFSGDYTSFFVGPRRLQCCENTTNGEYSQSSVGYWSFNQPNETAYPDVGTRWPANFTVKWIRGRPIQGYNKTGELWSSDEARVHLIWAEKPQMTALNCMPIIETANASITLDAADGRVISFNIVDAPRVDEFAWTDDFTIYQTEEALQSTSINHYNANLTTSHGVLFLIGLLGAADVDNFGGIAKGTVVPQGQLENIQDQTFNIRDPGLNVDLMTYSMLSLVNDDHQALLDPGTLERTAQRTFTTLFQHFVNNNVTFDNGGYVYQSVDERFPDDIGNPRVPQNNTRVVEPPIPPETVTLHISRPVELLQMSEPAAWICMLLLAYLMITSVILVIASRQYNRLLPKQVNSIADVAVLVAGSERLLAMARERPVESIKSDPASTAKLGWFHGEDGIVRWGIELADKVARPDSLLEYGENDSEDDEIRGGATTGEKIDGTAKILRWFGFLKR